MKQKIENKSFVSYIITFEVIITKFLYYEENTCHQNSMY